MVMTLSRRSVQTEGGNCVVGWQDCAIGSVIIHDKGSVVVKNDRVVVLRIAIDAVAVWLLGHFTTLGSQIVIESSL